MGAEIWRQYFTCFVVRLTTSSVSLNLAWCTANVLQLQSPTTIFPGGPITNSQFGLLFSLPPAGGFVGNIVCLWIVEKFGRKPAIILSAFPHLLAGLIIIFATNIYWLYVARILAGFANGLDWVSEPLFTAEICSDSVRGALGSLGFIVFAFSYILGLSISLFLDYRQQAMCALLLPILLLILTTFVLHETPEYLYRNKKYAKAEKSWKFYKGDDFDEAKQNLLFQSEHFKSITVLTWNDFFGTRAARQSIFITLVLSSGVHYSGFGILAFNSTALFAEMGSFLSPIQTSIFIACVQFFASSLNMFLIDRYGRRILLISSCAGGTFGMAILSVHNFFKDELPNISWFPVCCVIFTIFFLTFGISIVPFILPIDIVPIQIRAPIFTAMQLIFWMNAFIVDLLYFNLLPIIGLHGCLMMFADFCLLFLLFVLIYVPETKGKSYETIQKLLEK